MHDEEWEKEILWCRVEHLQNSRKQPSQKLLWTGAQWKAWVEVKAESDTSFLAPQTPSSFASMCPSHC